MLEKTPKCTNCGAEVIIKSNQDNFITCDYCGSSVIVQQAKKLSFFDEYKLNILRNNRVLLEQSIVVNDVVGLFEASSEVLKLIPDDFSANYYQRFAKAQQGDDRLLNMFYKNNKDFPSTEEESLLVLQHVLEYGSLSNLSLIHGFLRDVVPDQTEYYFELLEDKAKERIQLEDLYDDIPRDVFISYRSIDSNIAMQVVKILEQDGLVAWISERNLRPNDNINYWDSIERAIEQCELFVVISSQEAMLSRDVKREITTATTLNKKRLEIKIDATPPTTFFKVFFDGLKWFNASNGFGFDQYSIFLDRVHELVNLPRSKRDKLTLVLSEIDELIRVGDFTAARQMLEDHLDTDSPDYRLLWKQLFIDYQVKSMDRLVQQSDLFDSLIYQELRKDHSVANQEQLTEFEKQYTEKFIIVDKGIVKGLKNSSIEIIRFPDYVEEVGAEVFANIDSLQRVHTNKVKVIHSKAFASCENMSELVLGEGLIELQDESFQGCTAIANVVLPDTVISIGEGVFDGCESLKSIKLSKRIKIIPNRLLNMTQLIHLDLPEGVIEIGNDAFAETSITSLTLPSTLKTIQPRAFVSMYELTNIIATNEQFVSIDGVLFTSDLKELLLYPINKKGFRYEIPNGTIRLAPYSFYLNSHVIEVILPNSLIQIGESTFQLTQNIDRIMVPNSVKKIGGECFSGMRNLNQLVLGSGLEELVGIGHFSNNSKLIEIHIPSLVKIIPASCFYHSSSLEKITLPDEIQEIGEYAFSGTIIKTIHLAERVQTIPSKAFLSCRNLRSIDLTSIKTIGEYAFKDCVSLEHVDLGEDIEQIDKEAFANCSNLTTVTGLSKLVSIAGDSFNGSGIEV